jgi:hypothetical protein
MLRRLSGVRLAEPELVPLVSPFAYGMSSLQITFRPA